MSDRPGIASPPAPPHVTAWWAVLVNVLRVVLVGTLTLTFSPMVASAWCPMTTGQGLVPNASNEPCPREGERLTWRRQCIAFAVDERGAEKLETDALLAGVERSFQAWTNVNCNGAPTGIRIGTFDGRSRCQTGQVCGNGNVNTVAFVRDWSTQSGVAEVFAQTVTSADTATGEILDVDIIVNDEARDYADCSVEGSCSAGQTDLQSVMTHEVGHFFGLGHASNFETPQLETRDATMFDAMDPDDVDKRSLERDDREGYCALYVGAFDQSVQCTNEDFTPLGGLRLDCEAEPCAELVGGCGCIVSGAQGRTAAWWAVVGFLSLVVFLLYHRRRKA